MLWQILGNLEMLVLFINNCFLLGLNKIINSDDKTIISDSASTILKEVEIKHPVAKLITEIVYNVRKSFGDGSNSISILVGELAKSAEKLINRYINENNNCSNQIFLDNSY